MFVKNATALILMFALSLSAAAQEKPKPQKPQDKRVVLKRLKEITEATEQIARDYDKVAAAEAETDKQKILKHIALTRISKQLLRKCVVASSYFNHSAEARKEVKALIAKARRRLEGYLERRIRENAPVIREIFRNEKIREAVEHTEWPVKKRAEILRKEFEKSPQAASQLTHLAEQITGLTDRIDKVHEYRRFVLKREAQWEAFSKYVTRERKRAFGLMKENGKLLEEQLRLAQTTEDFAQTRVFDAPPPVREFWGQMPPALTIRVPKVPDGPDDLPPPVKVKSVEPEALLKALTMVKKIMDRPETNGTDETKKEE